MSRTLNDDFEDDAPAGGLDLETGSQVGGGGGASNYGGGGLEFDDELEDAPAGPLELDVPDLPVPPPAPSSGRGLGGQAAPPAPGSNPAMHAAPGSNPAMHAAPGSNPAMHAAPGSNPAMPPAPGSNPGMSPAAHGGMAPEEAPVAPPRAPEPPSAAALVAKYPPVPAKIWEAPVYFVRVLLRQLELRQDLTALRRRRSPDVPLYEAALRAHDKKTYALGMAITLAGTTVALFLFFLPVFRRFLWND